MVPYSTQIVIAEDVMMRGLKWVYPIKVNFYFLNSLLKGINRMEFYRYKGSLHHEMPLKNSSKNEFYITRT